MNLIQKAPTKYLQLSFWAMKHYYFFYFAVEHNNCLHELPQISDILDYIIK